MKETNIKNLCCSRIIKYFCAAQKSLLLFCAVYRKKQKYFNAFALLWDDTKSINCPGRAGFAKAWYMKSFSFGIDHLKAYPSARFVAPRKAPSSFHQLKSYWPL
jgi:hypothetical protein